MKTYNIIKAMTAGIFTLGLASCSNTDVEFPDYQGGVSVYFAYQTPVRAMMLGTDDLGSTADNDSRTCKIYGTMGGSYSGKNIKVEVAVDNTLCDNLYFDAACTQPVVPMPSNYYEMSGTTLDYAGDIKGGVSVKLTDAFFADPKASTVNYVIPVVMKSQTGADHILSGTYGPGIEAGSRFDEGVWSVVPKDYVLYCVKYVSKFAGYYLPMGTEKISFNGATTTKEAKYTDWERVPSGEIKYCWTVGENKVVMSVTAAAGEDSYNAELLLTFSGNNCTITSITPGVTASGSGTYTDSSSSYKWGAKDRAGLKLSYKVDWGTVQLDADYDMALQRRGQGNTVEEFTVTLKK